MNIESLSRRARSRYASTHRMTSREVSEAYRRYASQIAAEVERAGISGINPLMMSHLIGLQGSLDHHTAQLARQIANIAEEGIKRAVNIQCDMAATILTRALQGIVANRPHGESTHRSKPSPLGPEAVKMKLQDINEHAVKVFLEKTHRDGLKLSDRVWRTSVAARSATQKVLEGAVREGRTASEAAREVQQYLQPGTARPHKLRTRLRLGVSKDVSYQGMRLVRTEMNNAFHEGAIMANQAVPGYNGIYWMLSPAHAVPDICTDMAADASHGEPGFYPNGKEPLRPHPQCMCYSVPAMEDIESLEKRLAEWANDPSTHPDLEDWYSSGMRKYASRPTPAPFVPADPVPDIVRAGHRSREDYFSEGFIDQGKAMQRRLLDETGVEHDSQDLLLQYYAIQDFTEKQYAAIRKAQMSKNLSGWKREASEMLERFIEISPKFDGPVYRGIALDETVDVASLFRAGNVVDMRGTSSWSSSEDLSRKFADPFELAKQKILKDPHGKVGVEFHLSQTNKGASISHISYFSHEMEVLISKDARFLVRSIEGPFEAAGGHKVFRVVVEEVAQ